MKKVSGVCAQDEATVTTSAQTPIIPTAVRAKYLRTTISSQAGELA
jgi:hypothetical protein